MNALPGQGAGLNAFKAGLSTGGAGGAPATESMGEMTQRLMKEKGYSFEKAQGEVSKLHRRTFVHGAR